MSLTVGLTILAMIMLTAVFAAYELALASVRIGRLKKASHANLPILIITTIKHGRTPIPEGHLALGDEV